MGHHKPKKLYEILETDDERERREIERQIQALSYANEQTQLDGVPKDLKYAPVLLMQEDEKMSVLKAKIVALKQQCDSDEQLKRTKGNLIQQLKDRI